MNTINFKSLEKVYVIAEIGVNHEGDFDTAKRLITLAAEAGADAVKFQTYQAEKYVSLVQPERLARVKRFQLSYDQFRKLAEYARTQGITFFSTPLHAEDADFLDGIAPFFKISSGDLNNLDLIRHVALKKKPMIISTGLGTMDEIRNAVETVASARPDAAKRGELLLMHCVAAYPVPIEEAHLAYVRMLNEAFGMPVGYSDHTIGTIACSLAVAAGAVVIEKHFTYQKENQVFHDHKISADPQDLKQLISAIRQTEALLGKGPFLRTVSEEKNRQNMRRSIGAGVDIPAGVPIKKEWLVYLRPAWGIPIERAQEIVGKKLKREIKSGDLIKEEDLV